MQRHTLSLESYEVPDAIREAKEVASKEGEPVEVKLKNGVIAEVDPNSNLELIAKYHGWVVAGCFGRRRKIYRNPNPSIEEEMKARLARIQEKEKRRDAEKVRIENVKEESKKNKRKKKTSRRFCI